MATVPGSRAEAPRQAQPISSTLPVILMGAALLIGLAALLPLVQSSGATSTAGDIEKLEDEKAAWQARLHELETEVASLGSLDRIEKEARTRLKMVVPKEVHYLSVDAPPPQERRLPSRYLPPEPEPEDGGGGVWGSLTDWIPVP